MIEKDDPDTVLEMQSALLPTEEAARNVTSSQPPSFPLQSPVREDGTFDFDSFEPMMEMPPRRRSYTKSTTSAEGEEVLVSGEILVTENWRRHTRVYGGGVCKACEESERRMNAFINR